MDGKSRSDIEEITLAIALLGGVIALLLKISDYFNNNVIELSRHLTQIVYGLISLLSIEFLIIFLFFIFKGISIYAEPENRKVELKEITRILFKISFIYAFVWFIMVILALFFKYITTTTLFHNYLEPYYIEFALIYLIFIILICFWTFINLFDSWKTVNVMKIIKSSIKKLMESKSRLPFSAIILIIFIMIITYLFSQLLLDFFLIPSYLLAGSYSIDVFPQSSANGDNLTFTIKETGLSYNKIYIQIFKLNSSSDFRWLVDTVIINNTKENSSIKTLMLGENFGGIWYLNVNTSSLQPGNYLLHAEVTDDAAKNSTIPIKKHADKLFYIAQKNTNSVVS